MEQLTLEMSPVQRALHLFAQTSSASAIRAEAALEVLLSGVSASPWPEVAWAFSHLTGDGFPLEFTFSSADGAIRYTTEVAGAEVNETEKLKLAEQLMAQLDQHYSNCFSALFDRIQSAGQLAYGAWISGRHSEQSDRYKLYVEVPQAGAFEAMPLIEQFLGPAPLCNRAIELRLIGYEPSSSRLEFYFRVNGLDLWEITQLLRRGGLAAKENELLALLEQCFAYPIHYALPSTKLGFSFSVSQIGEPVVFSLFSPARSVFGSDRTIRRSLRAIAEQKAWNLEPYFALSEPITERTGWNTQHGAVSFVVAPQGSPALYIGLRPPEVCEALSN